MARLPIPGSDDGNWGDILNEFLSVELNGNGTLKQLPASGDASASQIVRGNDSRLSDARAPSAGSVVDVSVASGANIAQSKIQGLSSSLAAKANDNAVVHTTDYTAKGDIVVATASGTVSALPVGGDGQVLTADSTQARGVKWAPSAGGGASPLVWSSLTLATNVAGAGGTYSVTSFNGAYAPAGAALDGFGVVHLRGLLVPSGAIAVGETLAQLPSSTMWPAYRKLANVGDANSTEASYVIAIYTDGSIRATSNLGTINIASLDGVTFETQP